MNGCGDQVKGNKHTIVRELSKALADYGTVHRCAVSREWDESSDLTGFNWKLVIDIDMETKNTMIGFLTGMGIKLTLASTVEEKIRQQINDSAYGFGGNFASIESVN
jgi:hypothetical protein